MDKENFSGTLQEFIAYLKTIPENFFQTEVW